MATPIKWGTEFLVNTTTAGNQHAPTIATLEDGRFVIAWTDGSGTGGDVEGTAIRAQILNADGTASGSEFLVNENVPLDEQLEPSIAALAGGGFVIAFRDESLSIDSSGLSGITARIYGADGVPLGAEFGVNATTTNNQTEPAITALADGGFVVTWTDGSEATGDTSNRAIRGQVFDAGGSATGAEFVANTTTLGNQEAPTVAALTGGGFVIAWRDNSAAGTGDASDAAVRAQLFSADGTKSGLEFLVNTTILNGQFEPNVLALADGRFVVSWTDNSQTSPDTSDRAIRAQIFNPDGARSGGEFVVNTITANGQSESAMAALGDGRFVVAWTDGSLSPDDTSSNAVRAQVFEADGTKSGDEFLVNSTTTGQQGTPSIAVLADGRFVISWFDRSFTGGDTDGNAVRGQIFDPRTEAVTLIGTVHAETLVGTYLGDKIEGRSGSDNLFGEGGQDSVFGVGGDDTLRGGLGNDTLEGGDNSDSLYGEGGGDTLRGGNGDNILVGGAGGDEAEGG